MKHAYLIIAHNKFKQLQLLVDLLAFALFYDTLRGIIYLFFIPKAWNIHISMSIIQVVGKVRPDEIYNLAAQSHVQMSFDSPEYLEKGIVK